MIYVLIIVANVYGGVTTTMQEFSSVEQCKKAAEHVIESAGIIRGNGYKSNMTAVCMPK